MTVRTIEYLLNKFGAGKSPRSSDYVDLIDTLADDRNAVYFSGTAPADTEANPLWFNTSTNVLSVYDGEWISTVGATGATGPTGATGAQGIQGETGATGPGVAIGGTTGQYLTKVDSTNYNTQWSTLDLSGKQDVVANVSSTEIGYLDGVTSAIQTQLNAKATPSDITTAINNLIDGAPAALDTLNELAAAINDDSSFASTVTTALGTKAPIESPTFTGTVAGITKSMVGLGNVDNTTDAGKPVSTATQTALDLKANLTSPTLVTPVIGSATGTSLGLTVASGTTVPLTISNLGTGKSFVVEDETNPDASPFVIAADGKVGIGVSNPTANPLEVGSNNFGVRVTRYSATSFAGSGIDLRKSSSGTVGTDGAVINGDRLGRVLYTGYDGATYITGAEIGSDVDGTVSTGIVPTRIFFNTMSTSGVNAERMRIDSAGNTTINAIADATTTTAARGAGYMGVPPSAAATTGAYTIVAADAGEHIYSTATRTVTIPANASVAFPIGTAITFIAATGTTVTIAITSDTLLLAGAGTTGSRTLAPFGMATAIKITSTSWIISGNGLT
jgi:hypothetical protein